jgi:putative transposase
MNTYKRHRFPPDIISYAVWLYYRFNLSHRDIEDLLAERDLSVPPAGVYASQAPIAPGTRLGAIATALSGNVVQ